MEAFLARIGYAGVFLGTLVEGETALLLAGFLARRGALRPGPVFAAAVLGAFAGDVLFFALGRRLGRPWLDRRPSAAALGPALDRLLRRHQVLWIFLARYLYGIRWLAAGLAGASRLPAGRFVALALPACVLWAALVGLLGYGAAGLLAPLVDGAPEYEAAAVALLVAGGLLYGALVRRVERRRLSRATPAAGAPEKA